MVRTKIRQDFERNRHLTDLRVINMLLFKNQQEYQETMNCWKQEVSGVVLHLDKIRESGLNARCRPVMVVSSVAGML